MKSLVQLAFNPFFGLFRVPENRISGNTRSAKTQAGTYPDASLIKTFSLEKFLEKTSTQQIQLQKIKDSTWFLLEFETLDFRKDNPPEIIL